MAVLQRRQWNDEASRATRRGWRGEVGNSGTIRWRRWCVRLTNALMGLILLGRDGHGLTGARARPLCYLLLGLGPHIHWASHVPVAPRATRFVAHSPVTLSADDVFQCGLRSRDDRSFFSFQPFSKSYLYLGRFFAARMQPAPTTVKCQPPRGLDRPEEIAHLQSFLGK
jgi:hypothetical protein